MNSISEEGRRRKERIPYNREVVINDMIRVRPSDISEGGLYIQNKVPLAEGDIIEVSLPFKDGRLRLKAKVKHRYAEAGAGLMFIDLDEIKKTKLKELIEDLKTESLITAIEQPKVLLVEDDNLSRRISKGKLILEGFFVIEAKDGAEALELLRRQPVDIIVLDLSIGKIDGLKVLSI
jgi:hypothetical protein